MHPPPNLCTNSPAPVVAGPSAGGSGKYGGQGGYSTALVLRRTRRTGTWQETAGRQWSREGPSRGFPRGFVPIAVRGGPLSQLQSYGEYHPYWRELLASVRDMATPLASRQCRIMFIVANTKILQKSCVTRLLPPLAQNLALRPAASDLANGHGCGLTCCCWLMYAAQNRQGNEQRWPDGP